MKILVTGGRGLVGSAIVAALGDSAVPFDRVLGDELLDSRFPEFDAAIHSAALMGDEPDLRAVNVEGTARLLEAARGKRVVFLSSVDVLGVFKGERAPDYLPLDAGHPCYGSTPYGRSKLEAEELCRRHDAPTVILRPPGVWSEETYGWIEEQRAKRPSFEWDPFWEYGAFLDVRDLAAACVAALSCPLEDHATLLVSAPDLTTSGRTARELVDFVHPGIDWRGGAEYEADPYRTLLDIDPARELLGWEPRFGWRSSSS